MGRPWRRGGAPARACRSGKTPCAMGWCASKTAAPPPYPPPQAGKGRVGAAAGRRIGEEFATLRLGWSRSHAENLDGSDRGLAWIGDGRMQQMRDSRPAAEDVQDRHRSERTINSASGEAFRRLLPALRNKSLNFRAGAVPVKIVMPAIGKTHETLGLV